MYYIIVIILTFIILHYLLNCQRRFFFVGVTSRAVLSSADTTFKNQIVICSNSLILKSGNVFRNNIQLLGQSVQLV